MPATTRKKQLAIEKKVKAREAITPSHHGVLKERRKRRGILTTSIQKLLTKTMIGFWDTQKSLKVKKKRSRYQLPRNRR